MHVFLCVVIKCRGDLANNALSALQNIAEQMPIEQFIRTSAMSDSNAIAALLWRRECETGIDFGLFSPRRVALAAKVQPARDSVETQVHGSFLGDPANFYEFPRFLRQNLRPFSEDFWKILLEWSLAVDVRGGFPLQISDFFVVLVARDS